MNTMTEQRIERMKAATTCANAAITHGETTLMALEERLAELEGITCTGTPFWRDANHPTRTAKFYANHGVNESCPLHGKPKEDKRLRVYVGTDARLIAEVQRAMTLDTERRELERQERNARNKIRRAERLLVDFFNTLEWTVDGEGHAELSDQPLPRRW